MVATNSFEFKGSWVSPQRGGLINLIANSSFMRVKGDNIFAFLPYFVVLHSGSGYNGGGGIEISNLSKDYVVEYNDKKQEIVIQLSAKGKSESFDFMLTVYGGGNGTIYVSGSNRSGIRYDGDFSVIEEKKVKEEYIISHQKRRSLPCAFIK